MILRTIATELVDMSKNAVSGFMPSISPFGPSATASTSAGTGSEVNTTSDAAATCRGELAHSAPFAKKRLGRGAVEIVDDELVAGLLQIGRHALAHHAEPDETDAHLDPPPLPVLSSGVWPGINVRARGARSARGIGRAGPALAPD